MFVYVWWISLCECFQPSAVEALSHSHVVEWISGSRIQSHWPCMTLCPSSMFSRILATESAVVPASHAGGNSDTSRAARPPPVPDDEVLAELHVLSRAGARETTAVEVGDD